MLHYVRNVMARVVKVQVAQTLPKLAGATPAVIDGLCRRLLEDDSVLVQFHAAQVQSDLRATCSRAFQEYQRNLLKNFTSSRAKSPQGRI